MIGTVLKHRYEVLEKIGEGNLFTVYRCDDKIDNRPVAAKVLLPQYAANRMFAERLLVEAQAMVGLAHPGIVEVYDCGEDDGTYYVIVEYVRGVDLKERIRRNAPFSLTTVVDVGFAICDVLDYAHKRGFVHGDLRPGNIMVSPEGHIKLADFWVNNAISSAQALRTNAMMRSVHYMAPEVAEGKPATPVTDLYSLGVILFELLTASLPFDGETPIAIALKHARDPVPSIRSLNPATPKALEAVIARALQKSPSDRFRSAKAMFNELKSVRSALDLAKPSARVRDEAPVEERAETVAETKPEPRTKVRTAPRTEKLPEPAPSREEPEYEDEDDLPQFWVAARRTLLIVIGFISVVMAAMIIWAMTSPPDVRVPDFIGTSLEKAQSVAADKKIQISVRTEQFSEDYPAGAIYYMNPPAGRSIKAGKTIDVWVSRGSRFSTTPNVVKLALDDAKTKVVDAGLNVGEITQDYDDKIPAGNVIKQTPTSGTRLDRGEPVNLVFSLGPKPGESTFNQEQYSAGGQTRSFKVKFKVPQGPQDQKVDIIVQDEYGETTVYSDIMHPGDPVEQTVQGVGDKITIRIYIDDKLLKEDRKWR